MYLSLSPLHNNDSRFVTCPRDLNRSSLLTHIIGPSLKLIRKLIPAIGLTYHSVSVCEDDSRLLIIGQLSFPLGLRVLSLIYNKNMVGSLAPRASSQVLPRRVKEAWD